MSRDGETQKIRAKQVGIMMRHYRSSFPVGAGEPSRVPGLVAVNGEEVVG